MATTQITTSHPGARPRTVGARTSPGGVLPAGGSARLLIAPVRLAVVVGFAALGIGLNAATRAADAVRASAGGARRAVARRP